MNIFFVDSNPTVAAKSLHNKHIHKMALEGIQLLCNTIDQKTLELEAPKTLAGTSWKHTHIHHPMTKWVLKSGENWLWLYNHIDALLNEYERRYQKTSSLHPILNWLNTFSYEQWIHGNLFFQSKQKTPIPQCMPEQYHVSGNPVAAYRKYYVGEKYHYFIKDKEYFNKWPSIEDVPNWFLVKFDRNTWNKFVKEK